MHIQYESITEDNQYSMHSRLSRQRTPTFSSSKIFSVVIFYHLFDSRFWHSKDLWHGRVFALAVAKLFFDIISRPFIFVISDETSENFFFPPASEG